MSFSAMEMYGIFSMVVLGWLGTIWVLLKNLDAARSAHQRERRGREEMEAYTRLDTRLGRDGNLRGLAERVCGVIASRSPFKRVAMLVRDADGNLYIAASTGMSASNIAAIEVWASHVVERERKGSSDLGGGVRLGSRSLAVHLVGDVERAVVVPLRTTDEKMVGALVVGAPNVLNVRRRAAEEAVVALEALGIKLCRAVENAALVERLFKAEKLASLGLLAGGVAHSLNNPLTTVMGFAELIGEISGEERIRRDAQTIVNESKKMRETVGSLLNFWRPPVLREEPVEIAALIQELGRQCETKLAERDVKLTLQLAADAPIVRGNRDRLRLVLEHLLNNAVQAIAAARATGGEGRPQDAIRLTVSFDNRTLQIVVGDTGTGFRDPGRAFDLFYTTQAPGQGSGLGLSICYGIVREHGGEISAFNLHPSGAAVVVELPIAEVVRSQPVVVADVA